MAAYQAHDRVVAADSKPAATLALLQDWWTAWQQADHDPAQEVVVLAARRAEVDRLNTACQELLAARGRLGPERLQVEDRQLAVGDRVVCGHNAIGELGVANGSRGTITALDPQARTLTIRLDGTDGREVILPRSYLDGRGRGERNRRVDLAYATTGHRAQGLTRGRALVRLTGSEDVNWLYVQLSRARQDTRLYAVVGPEPQGAGELDLPDREQPDGYLQLAQALSRAGGQTLAIDTPSSPDLQRLSTAELRAERDRLRRQLDQAPRDRTRELARATTHREQAEEVLAAHQQSTGRQPGGMLRWLRRGSDQPAPMPGGLAVATQQANRAHDRERELRQHQQRRDGWLEANAHLGPQYRQVVRTLAWQRRATGLAVEADRPGYVLEALGPVPESTRGRRAWRQAAAEIEQYRRSYHITDPDRALGPEPRDPAQRADRQRARTAIERVHAKQRAADRTRDTQPTSERHHPAATSPAAWPARPGAGRRLAPAERSTPMASSRPWPFDDDDRPSGSVRPLSQADLQAILAHLGDDPDQLLAGTGADRPVVAVRVRASVGRPGGSAQARWRRLRAAEWAAWTRTLPWRVAVILGIGAGGGVLGSLLVPRLGLVVGVLAAVAAGWGLRFRPSPDASAWRRGAAGERRTARLLGPLERQGWAVLHDLAVPGSRANLDHLVIGPGGVFVIDSKQYRGRLQLDPSGRLWHGRYPLAPTLRAWSSRPTKPPRSWPTPAWWWCRSWPSTAPRSPGARSSSTGCRSCRPGACQACFAQLPAVLGPERVADLADQARVRFHAAA